MATNDRDLAPYTPATYTKFVEKKYDVRYISWEDWLKRWEELKSATEMVSWLHIIFQTTADRRHDSVPDIGQRVTREQILFCADIAKEYWNCAEVHRQKSAWEPDGKNEVVFKAISMLASTFLKVKRGDEGAFSWFANNGSFIFHEDVLPAIIEIFHGGPIYDYSIPRYIKEHEREILKNFLVFVLMLAWEGRVCGDRVLTDKQEKLLLGMRQKFIRILVDIGEIRRLLSCRSSVTLEDVKTLRNIVFKPDFHGRVPSCTGEILGLHNRNDAAETLLVLESSLGFVSKRREKIRRLTNKRNALKSELDAARDRHHELSSAIAFSKKNGNSPNDIKRMEGDLAKLTEKGDRLVREVKDFEFKLRELER